MFISQLNKKFRFWKAADSLGMNSGQFSTGGDIHLLSTFA